MTDVEWPEFVTVAEVAQIMRVSKMTVYRLVNSGELVSTRIGRGFRIHADSVRRMLKV